MVGIRKTHNSGFFNCKICGTGFNRTSWNAVYCSVDCRKKATALGQEKFKANDSKAIKRKIIIEALKQKQDSCWYCGQKQESYELDHIIPKSKNGSDTIENRVLACSYCNRAKFGNNLEDFLSWLEHIHSDKFRCYIRCLKKN